MWKNNIKEIHPKLTKEQEEIVYKNLGNMLIEIYNKYSESETKE